MKFFTPEDYHSPQNSADGNVCDHPIQIPPAWALYKRYLDEMPEPLPESLLALTRLLGTEDGLIVKVRHDREQRILTLTLRCGDLQIGYYDLVLRYTDAEITPADEWLLACLARAKNGGGAFDLPHEPDLDVHEVDRTDDGRFEHRLLFHPGHWFAIRCSSLDWRKVDRPNRKINGPKERFPGGPVASPEPARG